MTFDKMIEKLALALVLATFVAVPLGAWLYDGMYLPSLEPAGSKVFTLYWSGEKGITEKRINGLNYWRSRLERCKEIKVNEGDTVVFRLISADVHHGFALPAFGIADAMIKPGDVTRVEFVADKVGSFKFFCTLRCGAMHEDKMEAILTVLPPGSGEALAEVSRPDGDVRASPQTMLNERSLIRSNGEEFRFESLRGHVWVASFFFTSCSSACWKMNQQIASLQQEFQGEDVKFVSITCDPETDTPEVLKTYAKSFKTDADRWVFLTGDLENIIQIGTGSFMVPVAPKTHSTRLILVDRAGNIRDTFKALEPLHIARLKKQLAGLLEEGKQPAG